MLKRTSWIVPCALTVVFCLTFGATGANIFAGAAGVSICATALALWHDFRPRGKYDLNRLRELDDKRELANLDPNVGVFEYDDYLCPYCRTRYSMELRSCPKCGRTGNR
jgi:hypothetical protein